MERDDLGTWIERQVHYSARAMELCISATDITKTREAFGQVITPVRGSVVASRILSDWNPNPDYFFDWQRDSAIIMQALNVLIRNAADEKERSRLCGHFEDIVRLNYRFFQLDGWKLFARKDFSKIAMPQFLRSRKELCRLKGDALRGEARRNPDGTPNILKWAGPQYDGTGTRLIACMDYWDICREQRRTPTGKLEKLILDDLGFTVRHADKLCIGIWEEDDEFDRHYYTSVVQLGALSRGAVWADHRNKIRLSAQFEAAADQIGFGLRQHFVPKYDMYKALRSQEVFSYDDMLDALDSNIILAAIHSKLEYGHHSAQDRVVHQSLNGLERIYKDLFPINAALPSHKAPALGRNRRDRFLGIPGGNPWYNTTLGAAEFLYDSAENMCNPRFFARGESYMRTIRRFTPESGSLAEQFDRVTGEPVSCELAWSHAAMITAADARRKAIMALSL